MTFDESRMVASSDTLIEVETPGAHVDWRELDRQLRRNARSRAGLDAEEATLLLSALRTKVHEPFGFVTLAEYLEHRLGYGPRVAADRVRVAETLAMLTSTHATLAAGDACYSVVRELTRVAVPHTEDAWLAASRGKTVREVEAMVSGRKPGDLPGDPPDPDLRLKILRLEVSPSTFAMFRDRVLQLETEVGHQLTDDEVMAMLCRPESPTTAETDTACPPYQIALSVCSSCDRATQDGAGRTVDVSPTVVDQAYCDAQLIGRVDGTDAPTRATQTIPPRTRRKIHRRDHDRCQVPGCRSARWLHIHHIVAREDGGGHDPRNLILACSSHHRAAHDGRLAITGTAPDRLHFAHGDGRAWGAPPDS